jgi:hypothetical protein
MVRSSTNISDTFFAAFSAVFCDTFSATLSIDDCEDLRDHVSSKTSIRKDFMAKRQARFKLTQDLSNLPPSPYAGRMFLQALILLPLVTTWFIVGERVLRNGYFQLATTWLVAIAVVLLFRVRPIWMPPAYYGLYHWERTFYEWIGIRLYKQLVRRGPFHQFNPTLRCDGKQDLLPLRGRFMRVETIHMYAMVLMTPAMMYTAAQGWAKALCGLIALNLLINAYPVMLQRYNRARIELVLAKHMDKLDQFRAAA